MSEHPIQGLMDTALQNIRSMIDANTIIGDQITASDGTIVIPVSKVSMGFASGGSDIPNKTAQQAFGGGSGAGVSITPVAFIVIAGGSVKLLQISQSTTAADKAVSLVPELFDKITKLFNKDKKAPDSAKKPAAEPTAAPADPENGGVYTSASN